MRLSCFTKMKDGTFIITATGVMSLICPARVLAGEQRVAVGDVDRHRIAVGRRRQQLGHAGRAGAARHVHHRDALAEHRLEQLADETGELIGAAARAPGHDQFDRPLRIAGRRQLAAEQRNAGGNRATKAKLRVVERMDRSSLPMAALLNRASARGRPWRGRLPAYRRRLRRRVDPIVEVSLCRDCYSQYDNRRKCVAATANLSRCVSRFGIPLARTPAGYTFLKMRNDGEIQRCPIGT